MGYRVLIVEDDRAIAEGLCMKLGGDGHTITVVRDQATAYHALDDGAFDLVLLDLRLPTDAHDMDPNPEVGFAILKHIRDRRTEVQLPVIVMTAHEESSQTAVRALQGGASDYIKKPFKDSSVSLDDKLAAIGARIEDARRGPQPASTDGRHALVIRQSGLEINGIPVEERHCEILLLLARLSLAHRPSDLAGARAMTAKELAVELKMTDTGVRRRIDRFRAWLANAHQALNKGPIEDQDVIRNGRTWKGYEINFDACRLIRE